MLLRLWAAVYLVIGLSNHAFQHRISILNVSRYFALVWVLTEGCCLLFEAMAMVMN
jgi:hypothetical protein